MRFATALLLSLFLLPSARAQDCTATDEIAQLTDNGFANLTSAQGIGQSFTAPCSGVLQGIEVDVHSVTTGPIVGTMRIMSANGSGTTIATAPYSLAEAGLQRIPVPSLVSLTSGEPYTFFLDAPTSGEGNIKGFNGNPYTGGNLWIGPDADNVSAFGTDATFKVDLGAPAVSITDATRAYVWANDEDAANYTPDDRYSYNSAGGEITITRSDVGTYAVSFADLDLSSGGNIQVTAYGSDTAQCRVAGWFTTVDVLCTSPDGQPVDSRYTVLFTEPEAGTTVPGLAYVWASQESEDDYTPGAAYSYTPTGDPVTINRSGTGVYRITFGGMNVDLNFGHVQVSAYGSTAATCQVSNWSGVPLGVSVRCFDSAGDPVDTQYTLLVTWPTEPDVPGVAFAFAGRAEEASYTPNSFYSYGPGDLTATRTDVGTYAMTFAGFNNDSGGPGGHIQVSTYGTTAATCNVSNWSSGAGPFIAGVRCTDSAGQPVDAIYTILATWPQRIPVANEDGQFTGTTRLESYPNPSSAQTTFRYTLEQPAHVELAIYDALGRQLEVVVDEQTGAGVHTATLDVRSLPVGVYIVRMRTGAEVTSQRLIVVR